MEEYIKCAFRELYSEDGLTVMSRGIGIHLLFAKFARFYSCKSENRKLVFCLNVNGKEDTIRDMVLSQSGNPVELPRVINNECNSQERSDLYMEGGCYFITSRILIVDLLDNKVDPLKICGILVFDAHRISEISIESFILRVYKERNREGFVKGFTEDPESLQSGFGKVERLMKLLFVKKLYLWPRFRIEVSKVLESNQPQVIELSVPLTHQMKGIQAAIFVALNTCIQELKKSCNYLETTELTLENGLFNSFDSMIKAQLDPEWHKIPYRTKQIVSDLTVLRKLLDYLIRYDAFSFYYLLLKIQQSSQEQMYPSLWMTSAAADQIFKRAKERVYKLSLLQSTTVSIISNKKNNNHNDNKSNINRSDTLVDSNNNDITFSFQYKNKVVELLGLNMSIEPILECPPKWKLLKQTVKEIYEDYSNNIINKRKLNRNNSINGSSSNAVSNMGRVLTIVKDELTLSQIKDVLLNSDQYVMDQRYRWFISQQSAEIRKKYEKVSSKSITISTSNHSLNSSSNNNNNKSQKKEVGKNAYNSKFELKDSRIDKLLTTDNSNNNNNIIQDQDTVNNVLQQLTKQELGLKDILYDANGLNKADTVSTLSNANSLVSNISCDSSNEDITNYLQMRLPYRYIKQLSPEQQLLLLQERLLLMTPPTRPIQNIYGSNTSTSRQGYNSVNNVNSNLASNGGANDEFVYDEATFEHIHEMNRQMNDSSNHGSNNSSNNNKRKIDLTQSDDNNNIGNINNNNNNLKKPKIINSNKHDNDNNDEDEEDNDDVELQITTLDPEFQLLFHTHNDIREHFTLISDIEPLYIVLYDADISIIRQIETYQSMREEGSVEEHRYVGALAKEKKSFESLIQTKEHMVISLPDHPDDIIQAEKEMNSLSSLDSRSLKHDLFELPNNNNNNKNSNSSVNDNSNNSITSADTAIITTSSSITQAMRQTYRKIVVDVREFRCSLPSVLYNNKFQIVPRTIAVADYVLSPEICVERKGISDLFSSFASGRLYNQAESMCKYYKYPCLLIEFTPDKPFSLMNVNEISAEIQQNSIISKLVLLTSSFPNLKVLWSRSSMSTSDIFKSILLNHEEVDIVKAISVGNDSSNNNNNSNGDTMISDEIDARMTAQDILLSLPGINIHNFREVMNKVENLSELSKLSENDLVPLIGPMNAKKLHAFMKQRIIFKMLTISEFSSTHQQQELVFGLGSQRQLS